MIMQLHLRYLMFGVLQRCPLDKLILKVKLLNLGVPKAILALAISPPNLEDIERNILTLKEVTRYNSGT